MSGMLSFGHQALAKRIADELVDSLQLGAGSSTEPALVVGVFGEWGAGKSRLLQSIADDLHERSRGKGEQDLTVVVPFNAWRFEREEHLLVPLLRVAQQCLRKAIDDSLGTDIKRHERLSDQLLLLGDLAQVVYEHGGRELLQAALAAHGTAIKLPALKPAEGKTNPGAWEVLSARRKLRANARRLDTPISQMQSLYYDFLEHLKAVTGRNPSALNLHRQRLLRRGAGWLTDLGFSLRTAGEWLLTGEVAQAPGVQVNLVFLVDDLDRCLPDKAVEVLEAVKLFLEVEGCAFVLALDEEVIERGIAHRYRDYSLQGKEGMTPITGAEYLEKLVHLPVRLPRPTGAAAQVFLAEKLEDWFADAQKRPNSLAVLVAAITPAVPRKLMRMMSLLRTAEALGAGDVQMPQRREWLAIVCALQLFAPALYRFLRLRGARLLITLAEWHEDRLFRDIAGLKEALARQVRAADSQLQLQHRMVRQRLPDLCEAVLNNRSGFDLLGLLEKVAELNRTEAVKSGQLGAVMAFTEAELETEPGEAAAGVPAPPMAGMGAGPGAAAPSADLPAALAPAPAIQSEAPAALAPLPQEPPIAAAAAPAAAIKRESESGVAPEIARLGAGLTPQPFDAGDPEVLPALPEARLENEKALIDALASGDLELALVALSREGTALAGSLLPASLWTQVWDGPLRQRLVDWVKDGAPEGPTSQLLVELQPYLSQRVAHELIRRIGSPVQRWLHRPSWAREARVGDELALLAPPLVGTKKIWLHTREAQAAAAWAIPRGWDCRAAKVRDWPEPALSVSMTLGAEPLYGVFADLTLSDSDDRPSVTQRLRWIEPSTFVMGSSVREEGRRPEEGGLRNVRLTRGYWIADSACTQGLWRIVMRDGRPLGDEFDAFPVSGVTPVEVDAFLEQLNQIVEGCGFDMPTEAEWECACRAGTRSSYAFGARVGSDLVHAQGIGPVQARSLPPNAWGLFEMHGNVAEICRDWLRSNQRAVREDADPVGEAGLNGGMHAVRGGSFRSDFPDTRSAAVGKLERNERRDDIGFRFVVRSTGPLGGENA